VSVRAVALLAILLSGPSGASTLSAGSPQEKKSAPTGEVVATRLDTAPVLDGSLDEAAWSRPPLALGDWLSYNPMPGERITQKTDVWVGYDDRYLYIAFRCNDPEPGKIKTGIRRRDSLFNDDWVGLSLDSLGTRQVSYDMFVNPSGMQGDILTGTGSGEDSGPDWVWESAGTVTPAGYNVELRLPLTSIRFKGGDRVVMGMIFWRRVSRLGVSVSWPDLPPGTSTFDRHATVVFTGLKDRRTRELIPSATFAAGQTRETPSRFGDVDGDPEAGLSAKLGITSAVTIDATLNPDFSQVESDAFQVEVNQRYPVFFSEKRPFFMEGSDMFSVAGPGGDANMQTAVHTRRIIDPVVGAKVTASTGKFTFGSISASDEAPGRSVDGAVNPYEGKNKVFNIARATYSLGGGSYIGSIYTDTRFAGGSNQAGGADASLTIDKRQRVMGMALYTASQTPEGGSTKSGAAAHATYMFNTRRVNFQVFGEHYDREFQMDTAFYNQTGITRGWVFAGYNFYPDKKRTPWLHRVSPFVFSQHGRDRIARGEEHVTVAGFRFNLTRQGFFRIDQFFGEEPWAGQQFKLGKTRLQGEAQLLQWLNVDGRYTEGYATFYDPLAPFQGWSTETGLGVSFEPTPQFSQRVSATLVSFDRAGTGEPVYDVQIVNTRTIYQFNKYFFLRAILQFDSQRKRVLTDFLASYELRPGTVLFAGYGSLLEQRAFREGRWIPLEGEYLTTQRGLFFKASYLWRF